MSEETCSITECPCCKREELVKLYGDAISQALVVVDVLQSAIDRIVEIDGMMAEYMVSQL